MHNQHEVAPGEPDNGPVAGEPSPIDLSALLSALLRRWKLIAVMTVLALVASHGVLKLLPTRYKSTIEILVYDPQRQIDAAIQKPISPFVEAIGYDAINTEISILKSRSVALRVARELSLDKDPEFQPHHVVADFFRRLGLPYPGETLGPAERPAVKTEAERLDQAADDLLANVDASANSYIISVTATSQSPAKAKLLATTIARDYLANQREARQEALDHVAAWLKGRVDNIRSRVLETEASLERLKLENGIRGDESDLARQRSELNLQLMAAREEVDQKRARLEQTKRIMDSNGDVQSIPELAASAVLTSLRQKQIELASRAEELQSKLGDGHQQVIASRAALAAVNKQIGAETAHILGTLQNDYKIAVIKAQALEASLDGLRTRVSSETFTKLQQLRRLADADHSLYDSYLSQYNDISERRTLQGASARVISPASLPKLPTSSKGKMLYGLGGASGLGAGVVLALLLEYRGRGFRTREEVESFFGRPLVGVLPLIRPQKARKRREGKGPGPSGHGAQGCLNDAVSSLRIRLELSRVSPKVVLITSAAPAEGKSTAARLLAASSASAGRRTLLLHCDMHPQANSRGPSTGLSRAPGLSDVLRREAELSQVIVRDSIAKNFVIPPGSLVANPADWLVSQHMCNIVGGLRSKFDCIVLDAPPLLPVVDALALAGLADGILFVVAWSETPRASISEALKILGPEAHRLFGVVLNKADLDQFPEHVYGRRQYRTATAA